MLAWRGERRQHQRGGGRLALAGMAAAKTAESERKSMKENNKANEAKVMSLSGGKY